MTEDLKGKFYPTGVGGLPYKDPKVACEKILKYFKDIPFWPQLVRRSFLENMYAQFSERFPGMVLDTKEKRIYVDTKKDLAKELEAVYGRFLEDDVEYFSISREYAAGLYELVEIVKKTPAKPKFLKGQVIGPISFGLTVADEKKRSLFYDPELKGALVKLLSMKARWQAKKIKETGIDCIIFIDEPYMTAIGSSYVSLNKEETISILNEVIGAVHKEEAMCGMHCCGNTDWGLLLTTDVDILNFDAYNFSSSLSLYPEEIKAFLKKGGLFAWGMIPNTRDVIKESYDSLLARFKKALGSLEAKDIKKQDMMKSMLITSSCGLGLVDEDTAQRVMEYTAEFSNRLKRL